MSQPPATSSTSGASDLATATSPSSHQPAQITVDAPPDERDSKSSGSKRRFFGLGKKKEDRSSNNKSSTSTSSPLATTPTTTNAMAPPPQPSSTATAVATAANPSRTHPDLRPDVPVSPSRPIHATTAASPSRLRSSSPRLQPPHSPASSEIFERNVQEPAQISNLQQTPGGGIGGGAGGSDGMVHSPAPHIPTHVMTEDLIPPALEASAQAITSEELDPDEVEIVMAAAHQPAAAAAAVALDTTSGVGGGGSHGSGDLGSAFSSPLIQKLRSEDSGEAGSSLLTQQLLHQQHQQQQHSGSFPSATGVLAGDNDAGSAADTASNYGQLDPSDVRRLSFISFADVVQSEHLPHPPGSSSGLPVVGGPEAGSRDSLQHLGASPSSIPSVTASGMVPTNPSVGSGVGEGRAASPLRSPPILASEASMSSQQHQQRRVGEQSPVRSLDAAATAASPATGAPGGLGSSLALSGLQHGELTIETMRQAVRKTASGDLSGVRGSSSSAGFASPSGLSSPVSEEGFVGGTAGSASVGGGRSRGNT